MVIASVENVKEKLEGDVMPNAVLKDKEVGELWRDCVPGSIIMQLIRKLISERAVHNKVTEETAAKDFGINKVIVGLIKGGKR
ncbi:MAG: hypothetical protein U1E51_20330 [Candidatus Binatia bacterium]|nr:hypothetical protein [Candidatus Binatia bacterium]